jgi:hypothetical protein
MSMRRFTRLTNAFSKKLENHVAAQALYFLHYNFARIHQTLRVTPAMQAGIADHVWNRLPATRCRVPSRCLRSTKTALVDSSRAVAACTNLNTGR